MIRLPETLCAWQTPAFKTVFEREVKTLELALLPLAHGMSQGSHIAAAEIGVMLIGATESQSSLEVRAGIFFSSVIAGCSCADDPTPVDENAEYCELLFDIDKSSAFAEVMLVED
ncbi:MAG: hypothetical protein KDI43_14395 [Gammaproteobacteria bacterium]|nr:hypothetical protein [Gammaproteobacteria bacterium]